MTGMKMGCQQVVSGSKNPRQERGRIGKFLRRFRASKRWSWAWAEWGEESFRHLRVHVGARLSAAYGNGKILSDVNIGVFLGSLSICGTIRYGRAK